MWYNNKGWPASVAFVNILNNALLRAAFLQNNSSISISEYGITAINHPFPQTQFQNDNDLQKTIANEMILAVCVIIALSFIPANFLAFLVDENSTASKNLQFISGVKGITYWLANFLWDIIHYCISIACCIIIFVAFDAQSYVCQLNFLCFFLLLFLYGFALIPLMYSINYLFKNPSTGFVIVSSLNICIGLLTTILTAVLEGLSYQSSAFAAANRVLTKIFLIFPHYCLGRGLLDLSITYETNVLSLKYS